MPPQSGLSRHRPDAEQEAAEEVICPARQPPEEPIELARQQRTNHSQNEESPRAGKHNRDELATRNQANSALKVPRFETARTESTYCGCKPQIVSQLSIT